MEAPEVKTKVDPPTAEDVAAYDFMQLLPKFAEKLEELSNRQLKRVCLALMEHPLSRAMPHFSYTQERELFALGSRLNDSKFVLVHAIMSMTKEEVEQLSKEIKNVSVSSELPNSESGEVPGESNGSSAVAPS